MCHHITPQAGENGAKKRGKTAGKGEKTRDEKEKGKDGNRLERQGHGGTHCRTEEKEKLIQTWKKESLRKESIA